MLLISLHCSITELLNNVELNGDQALQMCRLFQVDDFVLC